MPDRPQNWTELICKLPPDAVRVALGFAAFDAGCHMEWPARRMAIALVLGVPEHVVEHALDEMVRVGLAQKGWRQ